MKPSRYVQGKNETKKQTYNSKAIETALKASFLKKAEAACRLSAIDFIKLPQERQKQVYPKAPTA